MKQLDTLVTLKESKNPKTLFICCSNAESFELHEWYRRELQHVSRWSCSQPLVCDFYLCHKFFAVLFHCFITSFIVVLFLCYVTNLLLYHCSYKFPAGLFHCYVINLLLFHCCHKFATGLFNCFVTSLLLSYSIVVTGLLLAYSIFISQKLLTS